MNKLNIEQIAVAIEEDAGESIPDLRESLQEMFTYLSIETLPSINQKQFNGEINE